MQGSLLATETLQGNGLLDIGVTGFDLPEDPQRMASDFDALRLIDSVVIRSVPPKRRSRCQGDRPA